MSRLFRDSARCHPMECLATESLWHSDDMVLTFEPEEAPQSDRGVISLLGFSGFHSLPLSPDHPLTQTSPTPTPTRVSFHRRTARMVVRNPTDLFPSMSDTHSGGSKTVFGPQSSFGKGIDPLYETSSSSPPALHIRNSSPVVDTAADEPLRLGYGALRHRELALGEGSIPSTFEVGQSSRYHQDTLIQTQHQVHETRFQMQQAELAVLRETDRRRQDQMVETLRFIRDMRREMSDMQAELLALREQKRRARQSGPDARSPDHQDASGDADNHI
ncbi:hypothetical protein Tco_0737682 [Tanacetum coccineum]